jgi:plasmid stabilization system protein ParE
MAQRTVVWTRTADVQFAGILQYWVEKNQSKSYSRNLIKRVSELTERIAENPLLFRSAEFNNTRVASMGHFSIYYQTFENRIVVTAFWDNRQDPKDLLKILTNAK